MAVDGELFQEDGASHAPRACGVPPVAPVPGARPRMAVDVSGGGVSAPPADTQLARAWSTPAAEQQHTSRGARRFLRWVRGLRPIPLVADRRQDRARRLADGAGGLRTSRRAEGGQGGRRSTHRITDPKGTRRRPGNRRRHFRPGKNVMFTETTRPAGSGAVLPASYSPAAKVPTTRSRRALLRPAAGIVIGSIRERRGPRHQALLAASTPNPRSRSSTTMAERGGQVLIDLVSNGNNRSRRPDGDLASAPQRRARDRLASSPTETSSTN